MKKIRIATVILLTVIFLLSIAIMPELTSAKEASGSGYSIEQRYDDVSKRLVKIRGLKFKRKVPYSLKSKEYLRKFLIKSLKKELSGAKFKAYDISLKKFGFVPANFDTWNFLINLYTSEVAGLYDYNTHSMFLMKGKTSLPGMAKQEALLNQHGVSTGDVLLCHEMTHALQDQYFDLKKLIVNAQKMHNDDYENALLAVIEGDATVTMTYYMLNTMGSSMGMDMSQFIDLSSMRETMGEFSLQSGSKQFANAPLFFKRSLLFPYLDGMVFVETLKKKGGWAMVNNAFRKPPRSTEQILHTERYFMKDQPILISWTKLPKNIGAWKCVTDNSCGEFVTRTLFEHFLPNYDFVSIAEGWGGDRYRIYEKGNKSFLVWYTTWDRKQDAKEFMQYYLKLLKKKYSNLVWTRTTPKKAYLGRIGKNNVYLGISGKSVVVMEDVPPSLMGKLLKQAWYVKMRRWN